MRHNGINPKRWFYDMRDSLKASPSASLVLGAAACEHWVQMELFASIAKCITGTSLTAFPEWKKRDIAILPVDKNLGADYGWSNPNTIIEVKIVYNSYSFKKRMLYVKRLVSQVLSAKYNYPSARSFGFLFGVHAYWKPYRSCPVNDEKLASFRNSIKACLDNCTMSDLKYDHNGSIETILSEYSIPIGKAEAVVSCVGQYFETRKAK